MILIYRGYTTRLCIFGHHVERIKERGNQTLIHPALRDVFAHVVCLDYSVNEPTILETVLKAIQQGWNTPWRGLSAAA